MRSQVGEYSRRAIIARVHENIELSWRKRYEQFLDLNGREPRPIDERSVALILVFFVLSWGLVTWQGMVSLMPAISLTCIVTFASIRFSGFHRAFQEYSKRRAEVAAMVTKTA